MIKTNNNVAKLWWQNLSWWPLHNFGPWDIWNILTSFHIHGGEVVNGVHLSWQGYNKTEYKQIAVKQAKDLYLKIRGEDYKAASDPLPTKEIINYFNNHPQ